MTGNEIATQGNGSTAVGHTTPEALYRAHHDESKNLRAGRIFLKFSKGDWFIGKDAEAFPDNQFYFVPAMDLFERGWQCWKGGKPVDEKFVPYGTPPILASALPDHSPYAASNDGWTEALKFPLMIVPMGKNNAAWLNVEFSASSAGGKNFVYSLSRQFSEKIKLGEVTTAKSYVLCRAGSDHYVHREFGRVYYPTVEIVGSLSQDEVTALLGKAATTHAPAGDPPPAQAPTTPPAPDALDVSKVTVVTMPVGIVKPDGTPVQPPWEADAADAEDVSEEEAEAELALAEAKAKLARAKAAKAKLAMSTSPPAVTVPPPEPTAPAPAKKTTNRRRATV